MKVKIKKIRIKILIHQEKKGKKEKEEILEIKNRTIQKVMEKKKIEILNKIKNYKKKMKKKKK